jgi:hypothetical protein
VLLRRRALDKVCVHKQSNPFVRLCVLRVKILSVKTSDFDYHLPPERIAQTPVEPQDFEYNQAIPKENGYGYSSTNYPRW